MTIYTCTCIDPGDGSHVTYHDPTGQLGCPRCGRKPTEEDCENGQCGFSIASSWGNEDEQEATE